MCTLHLLLEALFRTSRRLIELRDVLDLDLADSLIALFHCHQVFSELHVVAAGLPG